MIGLLNLPVQGHKGEIYDIKPNGFGICNYNKGNNNFHMDYRNLWLLLSNFIGICIYQVYMYLGFVLIRRDVGIPFLH